MHPRQPATDCRWIAPTLLSLALCLALPAAAQERNLEQILALHLTRYPKMQAADLYKLLHQAAMGSEHAVPSREAAGRWLNREIKTLETPTAGSSNEPLIEPLSPDGRVVRVNLRPYLRDGGDPGALLDAFVHTAQHHAGDPITLEDYCAKVLELAREGSLPFDVADLETTFAKLKDDGYPAVHHSPTYAEAYRPAYRVVLRELLPNE